MKIVALSGGVGGVKLVDGLSQALPAEALTVIVNTGDDLRHLGLHVSPDLDTVMYTLARLSHDDRGWGLCDESFRALAMVGQYGGETWFSLGDRDLGTHLVRSEALARGETLGAVTARLCRALGVQVRVLPMSDAPCPTTIETEAHGTIGFQEWLVRLRAPALRRVIIPEAPPPAPGVLDAIAEADAVVIGPSNPYVSIDPILCRPGLRDALRHKTVVAVSPIVAGRAVRGPLAEMIPALAGEPPTPGAIARHYGSLIAGLVIEAGDEGTLAGVGPLRLRATRTVMGDRNDRARLAREVLALAQALA